VGGSSVSSDASSSFIVCNRVIHKAVAVRPWDGNNGELFIESVQHFYHDVNCR
jgi:hypothetical protein